MAETPELYMFRGSQFVIKAMAAMALKGMLPGDGSYVPREVPLALKGRMKLLPAPHTVPAMKWGKDIMTGSDNICRLLDEKFPDKPRLYPQDEKHRAEVRAMEDRIGTMYWANGYLTFCDGQEPFERWTAARVHEAVSGVPMVGGLLWTLAPKTILKMAAKAIESGWRDTCRKKGGKFAKYGDIPTCRRQEVWDETQQELKALDAIVAASPTGYLCGTPTPSAADLTLYGMLERWVGDSLFGGPEGFGQAQPDILKDTPHLNKLWTDLRGRFGESCSMHKFGKLVPLKTPLSAYNYSPWTSLPAPTAVSSGA
mmetsp:Transcript_46388/g.122947  ORF Transcript_46388/g.122947 Transcript_46388/m.122947 type:complete len:312 (-) Transcript_46388:73-1008(-)